MKIRFNATGAQRKALVKAISEITGAASRYLGAPSFGYAVDCFTIDREGTLIAGDSADTEEIENILERLAERGFVGENAEEAATAKENEPKEQEATEPETEAAQPVSKGDSGNEIEPEAADKHIAPMLDDSIGLTISLPTDGFDEAKLMNLRALVDSKARLIKKALGIDALPIELRGVRLSFPWFAVMPDAPDATAYANFVSALCRTAKTQKRVTAKEREVENEKYTFRCFLLRLGFIGNEYRETRKILLRNLTGNGAFRDGKRKEAAEHEVSE